MSGVRGNRDIRYICRCAAQSVLPGAIILYTDTWEDHIVWGHPDVLLEHVQNTLDDPDYICASATEPGDWVLVCEGYTNEHGDSIRVAVREVDGQKIVTSAYYSQSDWHGRKIWERGNG
jgi:hypothetical protein